MLQPERTVAAETAHAAVAVLGHGRGIHGSSGRCVPIPVRWKSVGDIVAVTPDGDADVTDDVMQFMLKLWLWWWAIAVAAKGELSPQALKPFARDGADGTLVETQLL